MPVYTYRCSSCGKQFEQHQSFDDAPLKTCPKCKKKSLKKVITPTKIIFKGSGFYATDNKSASGSKPLSGNKSNAHDHDHSHGEDKSPSGEKTSEKSSSDAKGEKKSKSKAESKSD
jgi:putative FmdB family regulatory protein